MAGLGNDFNTEDPVGFNNEEDEEEETVQVAPEGRDVTDVTFLDDFLVEVAIAEARPPSDEYESDSEDNFSDRENGNIACITVSRSERPMRAHFCLCKIHVRLQKTSFKSKLKSVQKYIHF